MIGGGTTAAQETEVKFVAGLTAETFFVISQDASDDAASSNTRLFRAHMKDLAHSATVVPSAVEAALAC